jgi:hypothetical protein
MNSGLALNVNGAMIANNTQGGVFNFDAVRALTVVMALLLPYVFIEPAPVDLILMTISAYVFFTFKVPVVAILIYLAYLLFSLISISLGIVFESGKQEIIFQYFFIEFYLASSLLAIAALCHQREDFIPLFLRWYVIGAAISSLLVLLIKFGPDNVSLIYRDEMRIRLRGFFKDPNVLSPYLIFPIVAVYFSSGALNLKRWKYITLISCVFLMILTFSRGGYVALVGALLFGTLLKFMLEFSIKALFLAILFFLVVSLGLMWLIENDYFAYANYLFGRFELKDYDQGRFFHIAHSLEIGFSNPLGIGPGGYGKIFGLNPHNLFAGKLVDAGLIPAIIIISLPIGGWLLSTFSYLKYRDDLSLFLAATMAGQVAAASVVYAHHWRHMLILSVISIIFSLKNKHKMSQLGQQ